MSPNLAEVCPLPHTQHRLEQGGERLVGAVLLYDLVGIIARTHHAGAPSVVHGGELS